MTRWTLSKVDRVALTPYTLATKLKAHSTLGQQKSPAFDKVDAVEHVQLWRQCRLRQAVEFDFVASVYGWATKSKVDFVAVLSTVNFDWLCMWLDLQPVDIKRRWRHNWKPAQVVNSHLVCDPTIRQPGFDLRRQQWSLLNRFRTEQGHCGACRRKWRLTDTDLCPYGETQTMLRFMTRIQEEEEDQA